MNVNRFCQWLFYPALVFISCMAVLPQEQVVITVGWDKANHVLAFFVLIVLLDNAYPQSLSMFKKILLLIFYGVLIELIQSYIPGRAPSLADVVADGLGIGLYSVLRPVLVRTFLPLPVRGKISED